MDHLERDLRGVLSDDRLSLPSHLVDLDHVRSGARRRRRRTAVAAAVAALAAASVAGVGLLQQGAGRDSVPPVTGSSPAPTATRAPSPSPTPSRSTRRVGPAWGDADVVSVTATSTRTLVVLGSVPDQASCPPGACVRLAESRDGGATFRSLPVPRGVRAATGIRFGSANDGWLFGGGLWATHDGGGTWRRLVGIPPVSRLEAAGGTVWALADGRGDQQRLWSSPVGSDDWRPVRGVTVTGPADLAVRGDRVTVVGADGSAAWSNAAGGFASVPNPCEAALEVRLTAAGSLWATCVTGTAAYLATSRDGGATWTKVPVDTGQGALPNSVVVGARTRDQAVAWVGNGDTGLARITAEGRLRPLPDIGTGVSWLGFTDPRVGYAVTCCGVSGLARTDDGGTSWRRLDLAAARGG